MAMASPSASEASKLLEAALEQMDGIIQGAKFDMPHQQQQVEHQQPRQQVHHHQQSYNFQSSRQLPSVGNSAGANEVTEALKHLHKCLARDSDQSRNLGNFDKDSVEFVFNWLKNNLVFKGMYSNGSSNGNGNGITSWEQADLMAMEERMMQLETEKDNLHLETTVLSEQLDRHAHRIQELEQLLGAKKELLKKAEAALERERNQNNAVNHQSPGTNNANSLLIMQSELAQVKARCANYERENGELRRLVEGNRTPRYLPISPQQPPSPMSSTPDQETAASPVVEDASNSSRTPRGFKKMFSKIKRSNSGGHLRQESPMTRSIVSPVQQQHQVQQRNPLDLVHLQQPQQQPQQPQYFKRGGFRATAGGRLTSNNHSSAQVLSRKPFVEWTIEVLGVWLDSLGLGMYTNELKKCGVVNGEQLAKMGASDLESKLGMRSAMHRKKLALAMKARQDNSLHEAAQGHLDHHWVTRWLDDVGLPQYKDTFFDARVDGRVLNVLTVEDLLSHLKVTNLLHHLSIKRGIQVCHDRLNILEMYRIF